MKRLFCVPPDPLSAMMLWRRISAKAPNPARPNLTPAPMFTPRSFDASTPVIFGLIDERYMPTPPITYGERTTAPGMDRTAFAFTPMTLSLLVLGDFALNELYIPSTRNPTG